MRDLAALLAVVVAAGCSSTPPAGSPGPASTRSASAQMMLFPGRVDAAPLAEELGLASGSLGDTALARLLSTRLSLPAHVVVAVLYLPSARAEFGWGYYPALTTELTTALADSVSSALARAPRVGRAAALPAFIIGSQRSFAALQEAAARFQADLLLVYRPTCRVYEDAPIFGRITYQSSCTLEAVLLDTRTGIVPLASVATASETTRRQRRDRDSDATVIRAQFTATLAALGVVATRVGAFLDTVPASIP
jgi:hypothetical protein